jgi:hypothetical protein
MNCTYRQLAKSSARQGSGDNSRTVALAPGRFPPYRGPPHHTANNGLAWLADRPTSSLRFSLLTFTLFFSLSLSSFHLSIIKLRCFIGDAVNIVKCCGPLSIPGTHRGFGHTHTYITTSGHAHRVCATPIANSDLPWVSSSYDPHSQVTELSRLLSVTRHRWLTTTTRVTQHLRVLTGSTCTRGPSGIDASDFSATSIISLIRSTLCPNLD